MIEDHQGIPLLRYEYDSRGRYEAYGLEYKGSWSQILSTAESDLDNYNPFKWRSYYRDNERGYYYIKGRYYDEQSGNFLDADDAEDILDNVFRAGGLDRTEMAVVSNNSLSILY